LIDLAEQLLARFVVLREQVPGPRHGSGGGLVPCHDEPNGVVEHLLVGQHPGAALGVGRAQQHREQVAPVFAGPAPLVDDLVDRDPDRSERIRHLAVLREESGWSLPAEHAGGGADRLVQLMLPRCLQVDVEQALRDDVQRQAEHLLVHVDRLSRRPPVPAPRRVLGHDLPVGRDPLVVHDRLDHPAMSPVELSIGVQQGVAHHELRFLVGGGLHVPLVAGDQDLPHLIGVDDQEVVGEAHPPGHDVAVLAGQSGEEAEAVLFELKHCPSELAPAGPGREVDRLAAQLRLHQAALISVPSRPWGDRA
jgi:hypothetical protein